MNGFQTQYFKVATQDGRNFILLEDVYYLSKSNITYILPTGSTSDGASVPQALWSTGLTPFGLYWKAAYLHDCAYRNTLLLSDRTSANLTEQQSNELLKEAMIFSGDGDLTIFNIYEGVALGGKSSFIADRAKGAAAFMINLITYN